MNRVAKGRRIERKCYDELACYPYRWKTIRHKFLNIDFFGAFDVVAADDKEFRMIQCKTGYVSNAVREQIKAVKLPSNCIKEIWAWQDRKGWKKEIVV